MRNAGWFRRSLHPFQEDAEIRDGLVGLSRHGVDKPATVPRRPLRLSFQREVAVGQGRLRLALHSQLAAKRVADCRVAGVALVRRQQVGVRKFPLLCLRAQQSTVVVTSRSVGRQLDGFREVGFGLFDIPVVSPVQQGIAPVDPGRSETRVYIDSLVQVLEGAVKVAVVIPFQVHGGAVYKNARPLRTGVNRPFQVPERPVQVSGLTTLHIRRGPVQVGGGQVRGQVGRPGQIGDGQVRVSGSAAFQIRQAATAVGVGGPRLHRQHLGETPDRFVQIGVLATQIGLAQPVAQISQGGRVRRRLLQRPDQNGFGQVMFIPLQVQLAQSEQRNGAHFRREVDVDSRRKLGRRRGDIHHPRTQ